jgi:uncharacterized protein (TIGR03083 family)
LIVELQTPGPVLIVDLFHPLLENLLALLRGLSQEEWTLPTQCGSWTVREVAVHLLGGDVGMLSHRRDGYSPSHFEVASWDELIKSINQQNDLWVVGTHRLSPKLITQLLEFTGPQVIDLFRSLDPFATGVPVDWVGPDPAPVWLDLAREYTERWHHQQHIRQAVGKPGMLEPEYLSPVLESFVLALPRTFNSIAAEPETIVQINLTGPAGGQWALRRTLDGWRLWRGQAEASLATVTIPDQLAWQIFTKSLTPTKAQALAWIEGDQVLGAKVMETVSILA